MILHYLLHYAFLFAFGFACIISGPIMILESVKSDSDSRLVSELQSFRVSAYPPHETTGVNSRSIIVNSLAYEKLPKYYVKVVASFDTLEYSRVCKVGDKAFVRTNSFLADIGIVQHRNANLLKKLPIILHKQELSGAKAFYSLTSDGNFKFMALNNTSFVGRDYGVWGRIFRFVGGVVVFLFGGFLLGLSVVLIRNNSEQYKATGKLPKLTDKWAGLKYLFGSSENK